MKTVLCVLGFCVTIKMQPTLAQEWTKAQKEIWQTIENYERAIDKKNLTNIMAYYIDDFQFWMPDGDLKDKAFLEQSFKDFWNKAQIQEKKINPVKIVVYDTVSVVHYTYFIHVKGIDGWEKKLTELRTKVLMKKGKVWKLIASGVERQVHQTTQK